MKYPSSPLVGSGKMEGGVFVPDSRHFWTAVIARWEGLRVAVTIEPELETRRARASRYYWGVVLKLIADHTGHTADDLHEIFRQDWNTKVISWTNTDTGEIEDRRIPQHTRNLSVHDFYVFVESVRMYAASELGVVTPDPDQEYWSKRHAV